jgi:hypothetical protein
MALDDYLEPEVVIAAAVVAAVASPTVRKWVRKGAVYGLAGLLTVGDRISGAAKNLAHSAQQVAGNRTQQGAQADGGQAGETTGVSAAPAGYQT